ncbi:MAG: TIGR02206 family membrane protein [Acidobacteria bacterium]|nr:TIGR02206 family membrane protein [Acidobacteriota bacterium]
MRIRTKAFIIAGFSLIYGMQAVMAILLMTRDGIRMHAPAPGITLPREFPRGFPRETTVVGDAWIKAGISRIEVRIRGEAGGATWSVPAERDAIKYRGEVVSLLAAWRTKVSFPSDGNYSLSAIATGSDGLILETRPRRISISSSAASREFVFGSPAHLVPLAVVLALCIAVPLAVRRTRSDLVRDRVAFAITLLLWVHEIVYEIYWFAIGAWTVGNCLLLHMCALALMFLPVLYFSRDGSFRQTLFELLCFFGLGGAMQALFAPDIGMHGFPELKYFNYFISHGTIVLGMVYAAVLYRFELTWRSWIRFAVGTIGATMAAYGLDLLLRFLPPYEVGNYFMMGYPPPTGSVIDVFASIFGPAPRYLAGLALMGLALFGLLYLPYAIRRLARRRSDDATPTR